MGPDPLALIISSLTVESGRETSLPWKVSGVTLVSDLQSRIHRTAKEWKQNHTGFPFQWIAFTKKNKWCENLGTTKPREEVNYSEDFYIRNANRMFHIKIKENIFFFKSKLGRGMMETSFNIRITAAALDLALSFGPSEHRQRGQLPAWNAGSLLSVPSSLASIVTQHLWLFLQC